MMTLRSAEVATRQLEGPKDHVADKLVNVAANATNRHADVASDSHILRPAILTNVSAPFSRPPELLPLRTSPTTSADVAADQLLAVAEASPIDEERDPRTAAWTPPWTPRLRTSELLRSVSVSSCSVVPSSPTLPKFKPAPLSTPMVAGQTVWLQDRNGCVVEVPADPQKHLEQQARAEDARKRRPTPKPLRLTTPLRSMSKPLGPSPGKPLSPSAPWEQHRKKVDEKEKKAPTEDTAQEDHTDDARQEDADEELVQSSTGSRSVALKRSRTGDVDGAPKVSKGSATTSTAVGQATKEIDKCQFRQSVNLSRKYHIGLDDIKDCLDKFRVHDVDGTGEITRTDFKKLVRVMSNLPEDGPIPYHLLAALPKKQMNFEGSDMVSFEEFISWHLTSAYAEEMMVNDHEDRLIRKLAREQAMWLPDVENVKKIFDSFDKDKSGEIDQLEFRKILCSLMNVKNMADMSEQRLSRYWREVDVDGSGAIGFDEFLAWYCNIFLAQA